MTTSVYPGEVFQESLYFEPFIDAASYMNLEIDASALGIQKVISVKIPLKE